MSNTTYQVGIHGTTKAVDCSKFGNLFGSFPGSTSAHVSITDAKKDVPIPMQVEVHDIGQGFQYLGVTDSGGLVPLEWFLTHDPNDLTNKTAGWYAFGYGVNSPRIRTQPVVGGKQPYVDPTKPLYLVLVPHADGAIGLTNHVG